MRKNKGITLIALVITIIVLLILVAVSIATLIGENGILTQVNKAKEETRGANVNEAIELWKIEKESGKLTETSASKSKDELLKELKEQKLITDGEEVTIGSKTISIEEIKTIVETFKDGEIQVGDYVNYQNPSSEPVTVTTEQTGYSKSQTYEVDSSTTWRVLGLDEEEDNLLLISGSPIKRSKENDVATENPYLALGGAEGWYNCKETLDKICSIYKNNFAEEARSMKIKDITRALRNNNK